MSSRRSLAAAAFFAGMFAAACFSPDSSSSSTACDTDDDCDTSQTCFDNVCTDVAGTGTDTDPLGEDTLTSSTTDGDSTGTGAGGSTGGGGGGSADTDESSTSSASGGTAAGDTTPPAVVTLSPASDAVVFDGRTAVYVDFDEDIDSFSLPSFSVSRNGEEVEGEVSVEGSRLAFTLADADALVHGAYTATVTGVRDLADNRLEEETQWSFTVPEAAWDESATTLAMETSGGEPSIVADAGGNVSAVWISQGQLWSAFYQAGVGWAEAVRVDDGDNTAVSTPVVARMGDEVIVAWEQNAVRTATRDASGIWSTPATIAPSGVPFDFAASDSGNAALVFVSSGGAGTQINARYLDAGSWSVVAEEVALPSGPNEPDRPSVAIDADGVAVAVYRVFTFPCGDQTCQPDADYWRAVRDPSGTWPTRENLGTAFVAGWSPGITADSTGYFTATIPSGNDPQFMGESVRRFNAAGDVQNGTGTDYSGDIPSGASLVQASGHTILVYSSQQGIDSGQTPGLYASVYRPATGSWDSENRLLTVVNNNFAAAAGADFSVALYVQGGSAIARYCGDDSCFADPAAPIPFGEGSVRWVRAALTDNGLGVVFWQHDGADQELRTLLFRGRAGL